jgi:hypothetical protein
MYVSSAKKAERPDEYVMAGASRRDVKIVSRRVVLGDVTRE